MEEIFVVNCKLTYMTSLLPIIDLPLLSQQW